MTQDVRFPERPPHATHSPLETLITDFLEWLAPGPRPYAEVMEAWRTTCPRLTVWEDSVERGYVVREGSGPAGPWVALTLVGRIRLEEAGKA